MGSEELELGCRPSDRYHPPPWGVLLLQWTSRLVLMSVWLDLSTRAWTRPWLGAGLGRAGGQVRQLWALRQSGEGLTADGPSLRGTRDRPSVHRPGAGMEGSRVLLTLCCTKTA